MKDRLVGRAARVFEVPPDVLGETRLVVIGRDRVSLENHRGLVSFSSREVAVRAARGLVVVTGQRLVIEGVWPDRLELAGLIQAIQLTE